MDRVVLTGDGIGVCSLEFGIMIKSAIFQFVNAPPSPRDSVEEKDLELDLGEGIVIVLAPDN